MYQEIDNPDQRIQQDINTFCKAIVDLPTRVFGVIMTFSIQLGIINQVSPELSHAIIISLVSIFIVNVLINNPLIKINWNILKSSADYRTGLVQLRDDAEVISFYRERILKRTDYSVCCRLSSDGRKYRFFIICLSRWWG